MVPCRAAVMRRSAKDAEGSIELVYSDWQELKPLAQHTRKLPTVSWPKVSKEGWINNGQIHRGALKAILHDDIELVPIQQPNPVQSWAETDVTLHFIVRHCFERLQSLSRCT